MTGMRFFMLIIPVLLYFYTLLLIGSRREIMLSFIMVILLLLYKRGFKLPFKIIILSAVFVCSIIAFGIYRANADADLNIKLLNALGSLFILYLLFNTIYQHIIKCNFREGHISILY